MSLVNPVLRDVRALSIQEGEVGDMAESSGTTRKVDVQYISSICQRISENINQVIVGKAGAVELLLVALLSEGHVLVGRCPGGR